MLGMTDALSLATSLMARFPHLSQEGAAEFLWEIFIQAQQ
jgi:hypothetical protein